MPISRKLLPIYDVPPFPGFIVPVLKGLSVAQSSFLQTDKTIELFFSTLAFAGSGDIIFRSDLDTRIFNVHDTDQVHFDGTTVTISPITDWSADTTYNIQIAKGVIVNDEGKTGGTINEMDGFQFTTVAATNPHILTGPIGRTDFQVGENIFLGFDEAVMAGTRNIMISNGSDTRVIAVDDTSQIVIDGSSATIDPSEDLIEDGAITDTEGNSYVGDVDLTFATIANSLGALEIQYSNPINHTAMKADNSIELVFNQAVQASMGEIILSNGTDTRTIALNDTSQVTFDLATVTINPKDDLISDTTYTVDLSSGAIVDMAGQSYPGFNNATVKILPSNPLLTFSSLNSNRMVVDDNIVFVFDKAVVAGNGHIIISNGTDIRTIATNDTNQVTFDYDVLTINPDGELVPDTTYTVQIETGAVTDLAGHAYTGVSEWVVTPFDSNPYIVSSNLKSNAALKIHDDIELFFNEAIEMNHGNIVISNGTDTRTIAINDTSQIHIDQRSGSLGVVQYVLTINPAEDLVANTTYRVQMDRGIVKDSTGHEFAGFNDATFMTRGSDLLLVASQPVNGTTIKIDEGIQLFFDGEVQPGTGSIVLSHGEDIRNIAIDDETQVEFRDNTVLVKPVDDLIGGATYRVQMTDGAIVDKTGYAYAGFSDASVTATDSNPLLVSSSPVNGAMIKPDRLIRLVFDEDVAPGSGDITLSNGSDTRTIAINDGSQVSFNRKNVFINPSEDLMSGTTYDVQMASGAIVDIAGHPYSGFSNATVSVTEAPLLILPQKHMNLNQNVFTLRFDEAVVAGQGDIVMTSDLETRIIPIDDASQVTFGESGDSSVVIVRPSQDLLLDTLYQIQIASDVIVDLDGHSFNGIGGAHGDGLSFEITADPFVPLL